MRRFAQVDVFTTEPALGNPVAVVLDADDLDDTAMARFARWTNLSETTFVLPPTTAGAHYRLRIFTPATELPFAGHPTLGTCRALLDAGELPHVDGPWVQECGAGLIEISHDEGVLSFTAPEPVVTPSPVDDVMLTKILGHDLVDPLLIDVGPRWLTGRLTPAELHSLRVDPVAYLEAPGHRGVDGINVYAVDRSGPGDPEVHVRSFFHGDADVTEDPVCGSGNAAVGVHLQLTGRADGTVPTTYRARQGHHRGRDGRIEVTLGDRVRVGGRAITVVSGTVSL